MRSLPIFILLFLFISLGYAQSDTQITVKPDTTTIEMGDETLVIIREGGSREFRWDGDDWQGSGRGVQEEKG